jgi:alpha-galactosidase
MTQQHHLRAAGTSILIDTSDGDCRILHWGSDLGDETIDTAALVNAVPNSMFDQPVVASVIPQAARGWRGRPGLSGSRAGRGFSALLVLDGADQRSADQKSADQKSADQVGSSALTLHMIDADGGLAVDVEYELDAGGLLLTRARLTNTGDDPYELENLSLTLPVPARASEGLDLTGRWAKEKQPQRHTIQQGTWLRSARHGRTGHDSTLVIAAGTQGFDFGTGEVWAVHLGWSGNHESMIEQLPDGETVLAVGELLAPGEVVLQPGDQYETPTVYAAYSPAGLDGISDQFYSWMRARPSHPKRPRPVVLNTWEAVYFRHDLDTLTSLADTAAALGVERFVLDDGWFLGRRSDNAGLGDWFVDPDVWPNGLTPLIDHVRGAGMEFGLWVEPEMVNLDSRLAREHPDWVSGPGGRTSLEWRRQHVLDLVNEDAWNYIFNRLDALLSENDIAYLKWDQNRDQVELGHAGRASTHAQTAAVYRLFDAVRAAHPNVEIESCSSGGARVDLGILARTDRVWASDTNDALERQTIQRWTELVVPPELVGAHVGPGHSHTTGRTHDLSFRAITALFGHFGIEWDVREASESERGELASAIAFYKQHRTLLHGGRMVRVDYPDAAAQAHGVVSQDRSEAVFAYATLAASRFEIPPRLRLPGLDDARLYRVSLGLPLAASATLGYGQPPWLASGTVASGRVLGELGLPMPLLRPEQALVLTVTAQ